jgi:hypothetical protein
MQCSTEEFWMEGTEDCWVPPPLSQSSDACKWGRHSFCPEARHFQLRRNSVLSTFSTRVEFTHNLYGTATSCCCPVHKQEVTPWHHDGGIPFSLEQQCCASFVAMLNRATGWNNNQQYSYTNNQLSIMTGKGEHIQHHSRSAFLAFPSTFQTLEFPLLWLMDILNYSNSMMRTMNSYE